MSLKMLRFRKEFIVEKLSSMIDNAPLVAVAYVGHLDVPEKAMVNSLLKKADARISYSKNTLSKIALENTGNALLIPLMHGLVGVIAGPSEVETAIALKAVTKQFPEFTVLGATLNKERLLQARPNPRAHFPTCPLSAHSLRPCHTHTIATRQSVCCSFRNSIG